MTPFGKGGLGAIYARISDDKTGDEHGVARQLAEGRELADRYRIPIHHEYVDNDISATHGARRPEYERLLADIRNGLITVVIVFHLSRLWRNRKERAEGIDLFKTHGVRLIMVRGPEIDFSTAYGRGMAALLGEIDSMEVEIKSERQISAMMQAVREGRPPTGRRAFGYVSGGAAIIPAEADAVRRAYEMLLAGASVSSIAKDLNAAGFTTTMGRPWRHNAVRIMLLNERYAGLRRYRGELYPGTWPTIVSEETWRAACAILGDPARKTTTSSARRWLLTGLARCGVPDCGAPVVATYRARNRRVYRCRDHCHLMRLAEPIDDLINRIVVARLSRDDARDLLVDDTRPNVDDLRAQVLSLRAKLEELAALYADDKITASQFQTATERTRARLAEAEQAMHHVDRAPILADLIAAEDVAAAWAATPLDRRRAVVDTLMRVVLLRSGAGRRRFDPRTVEITWKVPG